MIRRGMTPDDVLHVLDSMQDELATEWVGTVDNPGAITALTLAGAAAGNRAIDTGKASNPVKAALTIDWKLINQQALDFARSYTYDLIRGLNDTTRNEVQNALALWVSSGDSLDSLERALTDIFSNASRAESIAQTESTRAYNAGAKQRWEQVGVKRAKWQIVRDGDVCPICEGVSNQVYDIAQGAWSDVLNKYIEQPAHPRCRCFARPVLDEEQLTAPPVSELLPNGSAEPIIQTVVPDLSKVGNTIQALTRFLNEDNGALANALRDPDLGLTQLNFDTDEWEVDTARTRQVAKQFVAESQNIQYAKDYLISLAQQEAADNGQEVDAATAEALYNQSYAVKAAAILKASELGDVKLTDAQQRRLEASLSGNYLDIVYTTESSLSGSLANQTKRKVTYGGNFYATDAARKEARREFLDRLGLLDEGG